jgi:hypothetical protein
VLVQRPGGLALPHGIEHGQMVNSSELAAHPLEP